MNDPIQQAVIAGMIGETVADYNAAQKCAPEVDALMRKFQLDIRGMSPDEQLRYLHRKPHEASGENKLSGLKFQFSNLTVHLETVEHGVARHLKAVRDFALDQCTGK